MAQGSNQVGQSQPVYLTNSDGSDAGNGSGQTVQGGTPNGATATENPVLVAGLDGTAKRSLKVNSSGSAVLASIGITGVDSSSNAYRTLQGEDGSILRIQVRPEWFNGTTWDRARGDQTGQWAHPPQNTASSSLSNTIATSGGTATVAFINSARQEVINPSSSTLWASWGTPAVNGAGSFPIAPGGTFATDRTTGTLTLLSTAATQPFTVNRYA